MYWREYSEGSEERLENPHAHLAGRLARYEGNFSSGPVLEDSYAFKADFQEILFDFEVASVASCAGDSYIFYKYFSLLLFKALSAHAWMRGTQDWRNPSNYVNQMVGLEREYVLSLFPTINQEDGNLNKARFIDWFCDFLDEWADHFGTADLPAPIEEMQDFFKRVYRRDYLINFRAVTFLNNVYRSPNPARFTSEPGLLEQFLREHQITLVIDLRGEEEAGRSPYIQDLLYRLHVKGLLVNFNEPKTTELQGTDYRKKAHFMGDVVAVVFRTISENAGATLIHCASGKDRTGIITALLQLLMGVSNEDIMMEYRLSDLDTRPAKLLDMLAYVAEQGGIAQYLEQSGFTLADQERLLQKMAPATATSNRP
jgi:protein tyrosine/serine phosphatase